MIKSDFDELVDRLKYWNKSEEGRHSHITDSPIFTVQQLVKVYGFDSTYSDDWCLCYDDEVWWNVEEYMYSLDDDRVSKIVNKSGCDNIEQFLDLNGWDQIYELQAETTDLNQVYYKEEWQHVNTHLTKEGAQAFIKRKQHDYGKLRVYVESLFWCVEFKELIKGLVSGEIGYVKTKG